ncbi:hypothetical protein A9W94_01545 [Mycobacterium asiaticum]|nr:hypothetical protein A9W94_01545 [Mycobacterium asiaticum]
MKLRQFQNIDAPPAGLKNHSKMDRGMFRRYVNDPIGLKLAVLVAKDGGVVPDEAAPEALQEEYNARLLAKTPDELLRTAQEPEVRGEVIVTPNVMPAGKLMNDTRLAIPRYQRAFSWEEDQVVDLCEDVRTLALRFANGILDAQHFFGGLVMSQNIQFGGWEVIDGQQRLTTFVLTLHQLAKAFDMLSQRAQIAGDEATKMAATAASGSIAANFIWTTDNDALTGKSFTRPRLVAPEEDKDFFFALLKGQNPVPARNSQQLLIDASGFIWRELYAPVFRDPGASEADRHRALLTIQTAVVSGAIVVRLGARNKSAAYRLFMVLNDRGMQLSEGDLLRAETLEHLVPYSTAFDRAAAAWDVVLSFEPDTVKNFLRSYYPSVVGKRAAIRDLVDDYRTDVLQLSTVDSGNDADKLADRIEQMAEEIPTFDLLQSDQWPYTSEEVHPAERQRLHRLLRTLKHELALPLLLSAARTVNQAQFVDLLFTLERFAFRYKNVCNGHADAAAKHYYTEAKEIRLHPQVKRPSENLLDRLQNLLETDADLSQFRTRMATQLRYNRQGQRNNIKWALALLDDCHSWLHEDKSKRDAIPALDTIVSLNLDVAQLDHIYPQNPKALDVNADLEPLKHTLGNLTLLDGKHNQIGSNTPFTAKKQIYSQLNKVQETQLLANLQEWTKYELQARQNRIIDAVTEICTFAGEKISDEISEDDTGEAISVAEGSGEVTP